MDRRNTEVIVMEVEEFDKDWPKSSLKEFTKWFAEQVEKIPSQYIESASLEFGSRNCYEDSYANIKVSYERPETDEEFAAREKNVKYCKDVKEKEDKALLRKLLEQYGE